MDYYPMSLQIRGWGCLVVGGGPIGFRRAERFARAGARVTVVSRSFVDDFSTLSGVDLKQKAFEPGDLDDVFIAQAATNDRELNRDVGRLCEERGILVNLADDPSRSTFRVPVLVERGDLQIAITTNGCSPAFASWLKRRLNDWLPAEIESFIEFLGEARRAARERIPDETQRARIAEQLASPESYARFSRLDTAQRRAWVESLLAEAGG